MLTNQEFTHDKTQSHNAIFTHLKSIICILVYAGFNKQQALWSRLMLGDWKIPLIINVHKLGFR